MKNVPCDVKDDNHRHTIFLAMVLFRYMVAGDVCVCVCFSFFTINTNHHHHYHRHHRHQHQ